MSKRFYSNVELKAALQLSALTSSRVLTLDGSGGVVSSVVTDAELSTLSGVTGNVQTQIDSKLSTSLSTARIFVGDGSSQAVGVDVSGQASIDQTGSVTLDNDSVIAKTLTSFTSGSGTVTPADSLLTALQKLDGNISDINVTLGQAILQDGSRSMQADLNLDSNKLINVADPTAAQDGATKAYVDSVATGLRPKGNVKAATTANITLSGLQTIDGYSVQIGDRILVKDQTLATENGIYVADTGAWVRSEDQDNAPLAEIVNGVFIPTVLNGTINGQIPFFIVSVGTGPDGVHQIGVDPITWDEFTSPTQLSAGDGIDITGSVISVVSSDLSGTGLEDDGSNNIRISSTAAGDGLSGGSGSAISVLASGLNGVGLAGAIDVDPAVGLRVKVDGTTISGNVGGSLELIDGAVTFVKLASGLVSTDLSSGNDNTTLPTTLAVQNLVDPVETKIDDHIIDASGAHAASAISYSNVTSGLSASDTQGAIDELSSEKLDKVTATEGDLIVGDATGSETRLGIGTIGQALISTGTTAVWQDITTGSPGDIQETQFLGANNVTVPANVVGLTFSNAAVRSFEVLASVKVDASSDLFEQVSLQGIQKNGSWELSQEGTGDESLVLFSITSAGQVQYTSGDYTSFVELEIRFRAATTSV